MKLLKHLSTQPFIVATGIAALVHSTWALAIYFSGTLPANADAIQVFGYYAPAFLIAFSLDVGQIVTSIEIRDGNRRRAKYATFFTFALATFFLQFLYISAHLPEIQLAAGIRSEWRSWILWLRDCAVIVLPALLPMSTLLYTFSHDEIKPGEPVDSSALATVNQPNQESFTIETPSQSEVVIEDERPLAAPVSQNGHGKPIAIR
jgi:hypothetical protein